MQMGTIQVLRVSASDEIVLFPDSARAPKTSGIATASTPMAITVSMSEEPREGIEKLVKPFIHRSGMGAR